MLLDIITETMHLTTLQKYARDFTFSQTLEVYFSVSFKTNIKRYHNPRWSQETKLFDRALEMPISFFFR